MRDTDSMIFGDRIILNCQYRLRINTKPSNLNRKYENRQFCVWPNIIFKQITKYIYKFICIYDFDFMSLLLSLSLPLPLSLTLIRCKHKQCAIGLVKCECRVCKNA